MMLARLRVRLRTRLGHGDRGSAVIEFVVVGILITMPVFYLVIALARLQAGAYAVTQAARESTRAYVTASSDGVGMGRARAAARLAFDDQGFTGRGDVSMKCSAQPCLTRGASVGASADLGVDLPFIPNFLRSAVPSTVHLHARHVEPVDRFGAQGGPP
ncbi:pilus assembly protein [Allobranchiibius huperziae]|uniref:TadE-like protein n=1 Tax=Allobranchiibius huperziae TaxID=1874116 RepID=A0A853DGN5_9MICO|nr:pilus assembly protein [Allobranchiibius huperziae]NYJ73880.1 hypothetical protein [Allobranchiibius huperziae]